MKLAIAQPTYFPWLGYFYLIFKSDKFIFLNDVKMEGKGTSKGWQRRNKIKCSYNLETFITIPTTNKSKNQLINEVDIIEKKYFEKHLEKIKQEYKKTMYFDEIFSFLKSIYKKEIYNLSELNIYIIKTICKKSSINIDYEISSNLKTTSSKTEKLIEICKKFKSKHYISTPGSKAYLNESLFKNNDIKLEYINYPTFVYKQDSRKFLNKLSVIDFLFNNGFHLKEYFKNI